MNLLLRPLDNVTDPVWSVIILVIIAVGLALGYAIYYILGVDKRESHGCYETTEQEVLLQLPSDGD